MAKREKKPAHKVVMTEGKRNIIQQLLQEYNIKATEAYRTYSTLYTVSLTISETYS